MKTRLLLFIALSNSITVIVVSFFKMQSRYDQPGHAAIFHKKNGMMESVEVGVRNGKIGGRCDMCTEGVLCSSV